MRPNVLTIFPSAAGGGAERLVFDQTRLHDGVGYQHSTVALRKAKLHQQFAENPRYRCLNAVVRTNPLALGRLHQLVGAQKIDLIHTHLQEADFYGYWLKRLNPRLVWVSTRHNTDAFRTRLFWRTLNSLLSRRTDRVIAVSHAVGDFVLRHERVARDKLTVVRNGIDLGRFAERPTAQLARQQLGLPGDVFVVGVVGRLNEQKGHKYLFQAVARLAAEAPRLRLLVVGEGGLRSELDRLARRLGIAERVSFLGFRQDMASVYAAMDVFCLPSLFEGLPLVLVEALACARVAIGTRALGITDVLVHEKNGFLVPPKDAEALASAILKVYRGDYDRDIGKRAREGALVDFGMPRYLAELERIYRELTASKGEGRGA